MVAKKASVSPRVDRLGQSRREGLNKRMRCRDQFPQPPPQSTIENKTKQKRRQLIQHSLSTDVCITLANRKIQYDYDRNKNYISL